MKTRTVGLIFSAFLAALSLYSKAEGRYFEQVTLTTDRQIYISGERIWFKALCTGQEGISDPILSKILYLELYDQRLNSIVRLKFRITEGIATGFLDIPSDIHSGNYYLRAYTQFLRNYTAYHYCTEMIRVINPQKPLLIEESVPSDDALIAEEGGLLLSGIPNKLAIRIPPALCKETVAIIITDADGREYTRSVPWPNGTVLLEFTPESGTTYTMKLVQRSGKEFEKPLPAVSETGIILRSEKTTGGWEIRLLKTGASNMDDVYTLELRSPSFNRLSSNVIRPGETIDLQSRELEHGMNYLLLRNKQTEIIQIRPIFINKMAPCQIEPVLGKTVYEPREKIDLSINTPLKSILKNSCTISVSLKGTNIEQHDLLPYSLAYNPVLFTNYIRNLGTIGDSLLSQIEALCILYSQLLKPEEFDESLPQPVDLQWLPEIRDAGLSGQILDKRSREPLKDIMVYASVIGGSNQVHLVKTNGDGKFSFSLNHLSGIQNIYICPRPVDGISMELVINSDFSNVYPLSAGMVPFDPDSTELNMLDRLYRNAQLNQLFLKYTITDHKDTLFYPLPETSPEFSVTLKDYIEMPVMSEVFSELIPFISVRKKGDQFALNVFDEKTLNTYDDPLVLLDGIPVFDLNQIMGISPDLVNKIDVVNRMVFLGDQTVFGIIRLKTSTKNFAGMSFPEYSSFIEFQSLTPASYPVFPDHKISGSDDRDPDFRTLLYWSPFMPDQAKGDIPFFTSDDCATYEVILKSNDGLNSCTGKTTFRVADEY